MKPVPDFQRVSDDVFVWHGFDSECQVECWSTAVRTPEGFALIDPVRLEEQALARMVGDDTVAAVVLTSGNHERGSRYEMERLDVPILAPEGAGVSADRSVRGGDVLFETLRAVALPGGAPGETAFLAPGVLVLGDALVHLDGLAILPDKYCEDAARLRESLRVLAGLDFDIACFAHGAPIVGGARVEVSNMLAASAA